MIQEKERGSLMKFLIRKIVELLSLVVIACSCASKPVGKPIKFWIFDLEEERLINGNSETLNFDNPKLDHYTCLNKEDLKSLYIFLGAKNGQCMDSNTTLDAN